MDQDVVIVAQSLGAFAGTLVAAAMPRSKLILLAPLIPRPGEIAAEWWVNTRHGETIADVLVRHGPIGSWGPEAIAEAFLHDVDPAVARASERYPGARGQACLPNRGPL